MDNRYRNILYSVLLMSAVFIVWKYRQGNQIPAGTMVHLKGKTMGPITYEIKYFDSNNRNFHSAIDSLLEVFNNSLNHYRPQSELSTYNAGEEFTYQLPYFRPVVEASTRLFSDTEGAFDPTVMPLVNAWGFGPQKDIVPDSTVIDSLRQFIGMEKVKYDEKRVWKTDPRVQLDFSAIAKGYGIDVVAEFLASKGIENLFVEIGGEVRVMGRNLATKLPWIVGVTDPRSDESNPVSYASIALDNRSMATSGNYFNYRIVNGRRVSHTIHPATGYPIERALLSATVLADNCMTADAIATAFMVMGHEEAIVFLEKFPQYDALLIYSMEDGSLAHFQTKGLQHLIRFVNP
jgi:FAD:protein FMN transferase